MDLSKLLEEIELREIELEFRRKREAEERRRYREVLDPLYRKYMGIKMDPRYRRVLDPDYRKYLDEKVNNKRLDLDEEPKSDLEFNRGKFIIYKTMIGNLKLYLN